VADGDLPEGVKTLLSRRLFRVEDNLAARGFGDQRLLWDRELSSAFPCLMATRSVKTFPRQDLSEATSLRQNILAARFRD
jgi:hypothetical protein